MRWIRASRAGSMLAALALAGATFAGVEIDDPTPAIDVERLLQAPPNARLDDPSQRDNVIVLDFWGTWCVPCVAHMPAFNALVRRFDGQPVRFVSVTDEQHSVVTKFLETHSLAGWIGIDTDRSVFEAFGVSGLPSAFLIDRQGRVAGITDTRSITSDMIEALIAGKSLRAPRAVAFQGEPADASGDGPEGAARIEIRPMSPRQYRAGGGGRAQQDAQPGRLEAHGISFKVLIGLAYDVKASRITHDFSEPGEVYEIVADAGQPEDYAWRQPLQQALEATFEMTARRETREEQVLVLGLPEGSSHKLEPGTQPEGLTTGGGRIAMKSGDSGSIAHLLELVLRRRVVDEAKIEGRFDCELTWDPLQPDSVHKAIQEQLGLTLEAAPREIELLVLEQRPTD